MSPENPRRSRSSRGAAKAVRQTKAKLRENLLTQSPQTWEDMEKILKMRLPNYQEFIAGGPGIIRDWFRVRLSSAMLDENGKEQARKAFQERHSKEEIAGAKDVLAVISQTVQ
ncbi:hypothetical protein HYW40_01755 [Candidatus Curtissbacteria bacterium]|nr:hypothetical protein [Candidatus Curtissbacteria bacterium]